MSTNKRRFHTLLLILMGWAFIAFASGGLTSCQSMPKPETPRQTLAYADATLTGLINAAATARELGRLTSADVAIFTLKARDAEDALNLAKVALIDNDLTKMDASLTTARRLLVVLNKLLLDLEARQ